MTMTSSESKSETEETGNPGSPGSADGTIQLFTGPDPVKVRRVRRDPRAPIVIAVPVGERERWVSVAERATVEPDGGHVLAARLAARYCDRPDPVRANDLAELLAEDQVRLVIHPETVSRFGSDVGSDGLMCAAQSRQSSRRHRRQIERHSLKKIGARTRVHNSLTLTLCRR